MSSRNPLLSSEVGYFCTTAFIFLTNNYFIDNVMKLNFKRTNRLETRFLEEVVTYLNCFKFCYGCVSIESVTYIIKLFQFSNPLSWCRSALIAAQGRI